MNAVLPLGSYQIVNPITTYQVFSVFFSLFMGVFVFIKQPQNTINKIFFLLTISIAGYAGANFLIEYYTLASKDPSFAYKLAIFFASFHPPILVLFSWYFPKKNINVTALKICLTWLIGLFFSFLSFTNLYVKQITVINSIRYVDFGFLYSIFAIYFCVFILYSFLHLLKIYRKSQSGLAKIQIKIVLIGFILAYSIGTIFSLLLPVFFHYSVTEFIGPIGALILVVFMGYAITKHHLMDIEVVIRKTAIYSVLTTLLTAIIVSIVLIGSALFQGITGYSPIWPTILAVLIISLIFQPLRDKIQNMIDKIFFKKEYEYRVALKDLSQSWASISDINQLTKSAAFRVKGVLKAKSAKIYLVDGEK